jgi:hypothetical protein
VGAPSGGVVAVKRGSGWTAEDQEAKRLANAQKLSRRLVSGDAFASILAASRLAAAATLSPDRSEELYDGLELIAASYRIACLFDAGLTPDRMQRHFKALASHIGAAARHYEALAKLDTEAIEILRTFADKEMEESGGFRRLPPLSIQGFEDESRTSLVTVGEDWRGAERLRRVLDDLDGLRKLVTRLNLRDLTFVRDTALSAAGGAGRCKAQGKTRRLPGAKSTTIRDLKKRYERFFSRSAGVTITGPFVRFVQAFFRQIFNERVSGETVREALRERYRRGGGHRILNRAKAPTR